MPIALSRPGGDPKPKPRQSIGVGKCAYDKKIRDLADLVHHGLAAKLKIGFVHEDRGLWRGLKNVLDVRAGRDHSGGIARISDDNQPPQPIDRLESAAARRVE